jgi:hypothetical protein
MDIALGVEIVKVAFEFSLGGSDGDNKDALAPLEHVEDFIGRMGGVDRLTIGEKSDVCEGTLALQLLAEDGYGLANLLQAHAGVEQSLDDFQLNDVTERIETL